MSSSRFVLGAVIVTSLAVLSQDIAVAQTDEPAQDPALNLVDSPYRRSDSPVLRLDPDKLTWPEIVPPNPAVVRDSNAPVKVEVYDVATGTSAVLPGEIDPSVETDSFQSVAPYAGVLPSGILPESVLGVDDRAQVGNTQDYPWRTIVKLFVTFPGGGGGCSGTLIDNGAGDSFHVLTAGHCVFSHTAGGWATSVEVVPGLDIDYMPYGHAWATTLRSYTGWTVDQSHEHDWAVVTIDRRVGNFTGWLGRQTAPSTDPIYISILNTAGYPGDLTSGVGMWFDSDSGRTATLNNHWYFMDTAGGQSGSPVWLFLPGPPAERYTVTVHAYADDGSGSNHGTRLNNDKFDRILTWTAEDTPPTDLADLHDDGPAFSGFAPSAVVPGESFTAFSDVRNSGTASSGSFSVSYYASTNTTISTADHLIGTVASGSISPFAFGNATFNGAFPSIPPGNYWVGWIIDSGLVVSEFDESNNTAFVSSSQVQVGGCISDAECSDGLFCNGTESCQANICVAGTAPNCDDGVSCTIDTCNEGTDSCDSVPVNALCDNGAFCDGAEICHPIADCQPGTDPCPGQTCDEVGNVCEAPPGCIPVTTLGVSSNVIPLGSAGDVTVSTTAGLTLGSTDIVVNFDPTQVEATSASSTLSSFTYFIDNVAGTVTTASAASPSDVLAPGASLFAVTFTNVGIPVGGSTAIILSDADGDPCDDLAGPVPPIPPVPLPYLKTPGQITGGVLGGVDCDGSLTPVDAAVILGLFVGLITQDDLPFPCNILDLTVVSDWDQDSALTPIDASITLAIFVGIVDVCDTPLGQSILGLCPLSASRASASIAGAVIPPRVRLRVGRVPGRPGETVTLPVETRGVLDVGSTGLVLAYDAAALDVVSVESGLDNFTYHVDVDAGVIRVASAGLGQRLEKRDALLSITFQVRVGAARGRHRVEISGETVIGGSMAAGRLPSAADVRVRPGWVRVRN